MTPLYRKAIQSIESSGGDYSLRGPVTKSGDRAYGAYQVMGNNIPEWTQTHVGRRMTPDEFLADKDAQDKVFDGQFGSYVNKYGNPQDAASAWFTGGPRATGANKKDLLGTSGSGYVDAFNKYIMGAGEDPTPGALSYAPTEESKKMPALSADSTMGPGILNMMNPAQEGGANALGQGLTGIGAALAGISSPEQAKALVAEQAAMQKAPGNKWTVAHVDPKTGQALLTNGSSFVPWKAFQPKADEDEYTKAAKTTAAKSNQELGDQINANARDAANQGATIAEARAALADPNLKQGIDGPARQTLNKIYMAFGFGDPATAANGDVASALSNKLALQMVNAGGTKLLPGSFSDSDRKFVEKMSTSLSNTHEANTRLLDIFERANKFVQDAEALRAKHVEANDGIIMPSFKKELAELSLKHLNDTKAEAAAREAQNGMPAQTPTKFTVEPGGAYVWTPQGLRKK
jgi:hypothetical protein